MAVVNNVKDKPSLRKIDLDFNLKEGFAINELSHLNLTDQDPDTGAFHATVDIINLYGIPLVILIGCVGNTLSLVVFLATHLRFQSSNIYLAFLNATDTLFLLCLLMSWLLKVEVNLIHRPGMCQSVMYFSFVGGFLSVYTVVSFTLERWVIVFHPLKKNTWCTRRKALLLLLSISTCALVMYSYTLWSMDLIDMGGGVTYCITKPHYYRAVQVITTVDTLVTLILPSIIIIILNLHITSKIWQFVRKDNTEVLYIVSPSADHPISRCSFILDKQYMESERPPADDVSVTDTNHRRYSRTNISYTTTYSVRNHLKKRSMKCRGRGKMQMRTTRSLVIVSSVFITLNLPSHAFRIYAVVKELLDPEYTFPKPALLCQQLFQFIYYFNFAMNFFLYSACSKSFRQAFRRLCLRMKRGIGMWWSRKILSCSIGESLCFSGFSVGNKK